MTRLLTQNLRLQLKRLDSGIRVKQDWDKLEVSVPEDDALLADRVIDVLSRVTGIANFARVRPLPFSDLESIYRHVAPVWLGQLAGRSFCVRVKRNGKHAFSSGDAERYIGARLMEESSASGVKLKRPDVTVKLEIREETLYLVDHVFPGLGGYPMGSQGSVVSLISGGFDSTVASYLSMKRGLKTHFLFFNLGGKAHEWAVKEIAYYLWQHYGNGQKVKFITVPFEGVVADILQHVDPSCMGVILKRLMLRVAERVAEKAKSGALVTGEAVAQVSSQTLSNLQVIDRVTETLVLRPLITMDKGDIIDLCREIGAEEFAANVPEYCGVISVRPSASVRLDKVEAQETLLSAQVFDEALLQTQVLGMDDVAKYLAQEVAAPPDVFSELEPSHIVIDIRYPNDRELAPLSMIQGEILSIPFYNLDSAFKNLAKERTYLLYCDKGVMSQLHAAHLMEQGHANIGVYRPT